MDLGIVGLARSGKTTLFNAVTHGSAQVGTYSSRDEPNVGVVRVPDPRLDALAAAFRPKKTTHAEIRWVDYPVAGFGPDAPGAQFLADLATMDALVHVVRGFEDEAVPHPSGSVDPDRDAATLGMELAFADLASVERRAARLETEIRSVRAAERGELERDRALLERLHSALEEERPVRALDLTAAEERSLADQQLVTRCPQMLVLNIDEADVERAAEIEAAFAESHGGANVAVAAVCARLEAELAALAPEEAAEFRRELGLPEESPLDRLVRSAYDLLGLLSFLTVSEQECRAWPLRRGAEALEAAGKVHSDMARGFIRAEVARWDELADAGSLATLRRAGRLRTEGKSYVVQDGEVLHILFNV